MMRGAASILLALALALILVGCSPPSMPLRVAVTPEGRGPWEDPMCHLDERGQLAGLLPELAGLLAAELGRPLVLVEMPPDQLYTSLERGEADLVLHDGAPPPGLAPYLALSPAWGASAAGLVIALDSRLPEVMDLSAMGQSSPLVIHAAPALFANDSLRRAIPHAQWTVLPEAAHGLELPPNGGIWNILALDQRDVLSRYRQQAPDQRTPFFFPPDLAGAGTLWQLAYGPGITARERETLNQLVLAWREQGALKPLVARHLGDEFLLLQPLVAPNYVEGAWISTVETARSP